jgi:hypothetical protein
MNTTLTVAVFALLWGVVLVRLPTVFRDAKQRALWATWFTLALCKLTALPSVNAKLLVLTSSAPIIPHILGIVSAFFLLRFISLITDLYATRTRAATYQLVAACVVTLLLVVLFVLSPNGIETRDRELLTAALPGPVVAYWVVLDTYLGGILASATAQFWRMSRAAKPGALRTGLRCIVVGLLLNFTYAVQKVVLVVAHALGATVPIGVLGPTFDGLRAAGVLLALAGALVPATGWVRTIARAYRSLRALHPLWQTMRRAFPDIILFSPRRALVERFGVDDVHLRLYRRVIEIRDGMLVLRDYLPAGAGAEATTLLDLRRPDYLDRAALAEACCIKLALHRLRSGNRAPGSDSRWAPVGADLTDEVRWMRKVSGCLLREEPVAFVAWWTRRHPDGAEPSIGTGYDVEPVAHD